MYFEYQNDAFIAPYQDLDSNGHLLPELLLKKGRWAFGLYSRTQHLTRSRTLATVKAAHRSVKRPACLVLRTRVEEITKILQRNKSKVGNKQEYH